MQSGFHYVRAGRLYFERAGAGTPVIFLHGFGLDLRMWEPQVSALADTFLVIRYDLRGYGRSSVPNSERYSHTDDLAALLAALHSGPAHIVGLSNGGRNALLFAMTYPQAVRSLTLADSALDGYAWSEEWKTRWNALCLAAKSGDLEGAKRSWLEHPLFAPARARPGVASRLAEMVRDYSGWHWTHRDPAVVPDPPAIALLNTIHIRTQVIVGERDLPDFGKIADLLVSGIKGASKILIPDAGHMSNMEAPTEFNEALLDFFK
jgi:pimeloyl-ACP methyl ester carboxylesterase